MTATGAVILDRYELGAPLGRGSFGHTFIARDRVAGRDVAIKVLDPREGADHKVLELFEREGTVLRSLRHQGIPEIFDVVRAPWKGTEATLIVMEYVEGESLEQIIGARRTLASDEVMHLFLEMLGILEYIHGRVPPILHRDIKPSNIIVRPNGTPALVDFGSARNVFRRGDEAGSTVAGTYGYMPYEQYMGQATAASDLFALGATFLHLLTGRPPRDFINDDGRIEVPRSLPGDARLGPILERLLQQSPAQRYATAKDVRRAVLPSVATAMVVVGSEAAGLATLTIKEAIPELAPAPREHTVELQRWMDDLSPSTFQLMSAGQELEGDAGFSDWLSLAFFSVLTAGVLPIVFISMARARRRKVRRFVLTGRHAVARIDTISVEKGAFDVPMAKVGFLYEVDGFVRRGADLVLPAVADRWRPGDTIHILYDPERYSGSMIVSKS